MALRGTLESMSVADLIQHTCTERKTARVRLQSNGAEGHLFFRDGAVIHAINNDTEGEEVIYDLLNWIDGEFEMENDISSPVRSIHTTWTALLIEGARRIDERSNESTLITVNEEEANMAPKKKSELLSEAIAELLTESSDIQGAAIVGKDGLIYSANIPQKALDEDMVGASSAAILGLSMRSCDQLKRGSYLQTLVQADDGNIIVSQLDDDTLFVALTPKAINLGMAFAEVRSMGDRVRPLLAS